MGQCTKLTVTSTYLRCFIWFSSVLKASTTRVFFVLFFLVALTHLTLLQLPYFWDEGGYYIPAALDFYHTGQLVPHFTNAHPPLPNVVLGLLWHVVGFHILATRLLVCAFAAGGLTAVFRLARRLLGDSVAFAVTVLTLVYPIWFAQSSLAHADIFAAAFTLWAFALYIPADGVSGSRTKVRVAVLFTLAALSKETSIVEPAALAAMQLVLLARDGRDKTLRRERLRWITALSFPLLPLVGWYAYHHHVTGFTFGNPEYLRYNATANLTVGHILQAVRYRFLHLFWQRNIWVPIVLAVACLFLPRRWPQRLKPQSGAAGYGTAEAVPFRVSSTRDVSKAKSRGMAGEDGSAEAVPYRMVLESATLRVIGVLVAANWLAFSVLGGALLTRYLLPIYPLVLLVCVDVWRSRTRWWGVLGGVTAAAFLTALWVNPPTSFAPEDNLTYRDMVVVHQEAIDYVAQHYTDATVLTAWPVAADIFNPWLGYVRRPMKATSIEDFTLPQIQKAAAAPGKYDTAIVFTTHFVTPSFRHYLLAHPDSARGREFAATRDLSPEEIAALLGGHIVWKDDRNGEWAAVLRFDRSYDARLVPCAAILESGFCRAKS
jgi:4-amino-4-deoxy-L-arabinose transferase-like glycosyltransferase